MRCPVWSVLALAQALVLAGCAAAPRRVAEPTRSAPRTRPSAAAPACHDTAVPRWPTDAPYGELLQWIARTEPPLDLWYSASVTFPATAPTYVRAMDASRLAVLGRSGSTTLCLLPRPPDLADGANGRSASRRPRNDDVCDHFEVAFTSVAGAQGGFDGSAHVDLCHLAESGTEATCYRWLLSRHELHRSGIRPVAAQPAGDPASPALGELQPALEPSNLERGLSPAFPELASFDVGAIRMPAAASGQLPVITFRTNGMSGGHWLVRSEGRWHVGLLDPGDARVWATPAPKLLGVGAGFRLHRQRAGASAPRDGESATITDTPPEPCSASPPSGAPRVRAGLVRIRGSLSKEVFRRIVHRRHAEVNACYEDALTRYPDLQGLVVIRVQIDPRGHVAGARVEQSTVAEPALDRCVADAVSRCVFPPPEGGGTVTADYPFVLDRAPPPSGQEELPVR